MKRSLFILQIFLLAIFLSACQSKEDKLKAEIEKANQECPIPIPGLGTMESVAYEGGNLVFNYELNEMDISLIRDNKAMMKDVMIQNFIDALDQELAENLRENNAGVCFRFIDSKTGEIVDFEYSAEEIQQ